MVDVSGILVTRGDIDWYPILDSWPEHWEKIVWDNGNGIVTIFPRPFPDGSCEEWIEHDATNLSVYGRYAAIDHVTNEMVYVQDDDCIVSDPQKIVAAYQPRRVVCNMPPQFRHDFYQQHALVGFGAAFKWSAWGNAYGRFLVHHAFSDLGQAPGFLTRTCDIILTALNDRILVDVPVENLPYAEDENRMYRQPGHVEERTRMLELALRVRD